MDSPKYTYKLEWLSAVRAWLQLELAAHPRLAVVGDFNVAPEDRDVHSPKRWAGQVLVSEPERQAFRALLDLGLHDTFRLHAQPEKVFSWWNYGRLGFPATGACASITCWSPKLWRPRAWAARWTWSRVVTSDHRTTRR
ncbi:hypothetical protein ACFSC4_23725 [Deinococcus malanensis]|uniref:hypothetical protein n=1 Tax=Deinococcus malanensis TaxID=1706855 RepID=UPI0036334650